MGRSYSIEHAAALVANMPRGSALGRAVDPSQAWGVTDYILTAIEYDLRCISWQLAGDRRAKRPKPIETPERSATRARSIARETKEKRDRIESILNRIQGGGDY